MILLKCPACERFVEAPDELADDERRCYRCDRALVVVDQAAAALRARAFAGQLWGMFVGGLLGLVLVPMLGAFGGPIGAAIALGIAGAAIGAAVGYAQGLLEGLEWSILLQNYSMLPYWANILMVLGFLGGVFTGVAFALDLDSQPPAARLTLLALTALAGAVVGALVGGRIGRSLSTR
jgi:hypothetical protein